MSVTEPYRVVPMTKLRKGEKRKKNIILYFTVNNVEIKFVIPFFTGGKKKYCHTFLYNPGIDFRL